MSPRDDQPSDAPESPTEDSGTDLPDPSELGELQKAPRQSAMEAIKRLTGIDSKVLLPEDDDSAELIDTQSDEVKTAPRRTEQYQILGEIARGGVGVILKGHDLDLGRDVAMKVLRPEHTDRSSMIQRFVEEAQIGGQLQHPGIVPVYEMGIRDDGRPFFTMKLVKGRTLASLLLERVEPGTERRRFLTIFEDICQTMAYAHTKGVVHRDLKPSNIMVGAFGEVLVVDWGLAKVLARGGNIDEKKVQTIQSQISVVETIRSAPGTQGSDSITGSVLGTPAYMAPEQARGEVEKVDQRADVFSLGCILCEILTGDPPYAGPQNEMLLKAAGAHLDDALARLARCGADAEMIELTRSCLAPAMSARPKDAGAIATAIRAHLESVEERARQAEIAVTEARQKRRLTLLGAAALLLVVIVGGGGWWFVSSQQAAELGRTEAGVGAALAEARTLHEQGRNEEAGRALERARAAMASGRASPDLAGRVEELDKRVSDALRNERFLTRLDDIIHHRPEQTDADRAMDAELVQSSFDADREFRTAFIEFGIDPTSLSLEDAFFRVRETGAAVEICRVLDHWAAVLREKHGTDFQTARHLVRIALRSDDDPDRIRLREAVLAQDQETLEALAAAQDVRTLPAATAHVLRTALEQVDSDDEALAFGLRYVTEHPADLMMRSGVAELLFEKNRLEESILHFEAARVLAPTRRDTLLDLGSVYHAADRHDEEARVLALAARYYPESARSNESIAASLQEQGDLDGAIEARRKAVTQGGYRWSSFERLADLILERDGPEAAYAELERMEARFEDSAQDLTYLGHAYDNLGHEQDALRVFRRSLHLDPSLSVSWGELTTHISPIPEDLVDQARESLEQGIRSASLLRVLGVDAQNQGDLALAEEYLRQALDVDPDHESALESLATLIFRRTQFERGLFEELLELSERRLRTGSPLRQSLRYRAAALENLGRRDESIDARLGFLSTASSLGGDDADAARIMVRDLLEAGRLVEALEQAERAARIAPEYGFLRCQLGAVYWRLGRKNEAMEQLEQGVALTGYQAHFRWLIAGWTLASDPHLDEEQYERAAGFGRLLINNEPTFPAGYVIHALALVRTDEAEWAVEEMEKAELRRLKRVRREELMNGAFELVYALALARSDRPEEARIWLGKARSEVDRHDVRDPVLLNLRDEAEQAIFDAEN